MFDYKPMIIMDTRESRKVKMALEELGCEITDKQITPADYVLADDCAVERKTFSDFLMSIYDGRLFEQVKRVSQAYKKSVLIVEGDFNSELGLISNPRVFWGALAKVMAEHHIAVIFTIDIDQTALFLYSLALKVQEEKREHLTARLKPRVFTLRQRQLMMIQSFPNVGPQRAMRLLEEFGSVRKIFLASESELCSIEGVGKKTVAEIRKLLDTKYPGLDV